MEQTMVEQTKTGIVAPGRSIHAGGTKIYQPGQIFTASPEEIAKLTKLGYLVDEQRVPRPHATVPVLILPARA
jgi:hypothetical protein